MWDEEEGVPAGDHHDHDHPGPNAHALMPLVDDRPVGMAQVAERLRLIEQRHEEEHKEPEVAEEILGLHQRNHKGLNVDAGKRRC